MKIIIAIKFVNSVTTEVIKKVLIQCVSENKSA